MILLVVIINYNGCHDTIECLVSLIQQIKINDFIIVLDNFSNPNDRKQLEDAIEKLDNKKIIFIKSEINRGFAGGNNFAMQNVRNKFWDYVLYLNNDTVLEDGALETLLLTAQMMQADLAGPKILYYDEPQIVWHGAGFYNSFRQGPVVPDLNKPDHGDTQPKIAQFLTGCALLISRRAYEILGPLDEHYFFIQEDWDYCYTASQQGMRLIYVPASRIRHKVSRSSGGWLSAFSLYHQARGRAYFIKKHYHGITRGFHWLYLLTVISGIKNFQIFQSSGNFKERFLTKPLAWWQGCLSEIFGRV